MCVFGFGSGFCFVVVPVPVFVLYWIWFRSRIRFRWIGWTGFGFIVALVSVPDLVCVALVSVPDFVWIWFRSQQQTKFVWFAYVFESQSKNLIWFGFKAGPATRQRQSIAIASSERTPRNRFRDE